MSANIGYNPPTFPRQTIPESQKTLKWYKENIDVGVSIVEYEKEQGLRSTRDEKISNVNLFNDIVNPKEVQAVINPYNIQGKFPDTYKNYPVSNSNLQLLFGEERRRLFNPTAFVINSDILNSEQEIIDEKFRDLLITNVMNPEFSQEQVKKAVMDLDKWRKYSYQDMYERMSNQVIQYFINATDIKEHWSRNFEDLLIQGEEISSIDILGDRVVFERLNPLDVYTYRSDANSYKIEDSDWICVSRFLPIGEVVDSYHDYLTKSDREYLQDILEKQTSGSMLFADGQLMADNYNMEDMVKQIGLDNIIYNSENGTKKFNRAFDSSGNVRVTRVLWKGQRKIGVLTYKDEEGVQQKEYVDEKYKANLELGEKVKWIYISEWYEGTKIGEDIYLKYGPRPVQFRDPDNPSLCHPGIVGNVLNTNSSRAKSLLSYMKPYQLLYNFFMYRLQQDIMKYQGSIARFNTSMIPDNWTMDKVMYYMQQFGLLVEDPMNEGQEGAATGKLAGSLGYNPGGNLQIGDPNLINVNIMMLQFLEERIADISGVTPQRKGSIENRETVGGVERSVMQSSNNTEKYFSIHDNYKLRCLKVLVGTCAVAWKDKKEKKAFLMDDGTKTILDFDGSKFKLGTYGISIGSSSDTTNMMNDIKALAQPLMQNGGGISQIIDIYNTKSPASLKRKMEEFEEQQRAREENMQQQQIQVQQEQIAAQKEVEAARMEHERLLKEMELNTKLQIEAMKNGGEGDGSDLEKLALEREKLSAQIKLQEDQLKETIRHNKAAESISKMQKRSQNSTK